MKTYELVSGDVRYLNIMVKHGWTIVDTFPNPYPEPYFFALMENDNSLAVNYDVGAVYEFVHSKYRFDQLKLDFWNKAENDQKRKDNP